MSQSLKRAGRGSRPTRFLLLTDIPPTPSYSGGLLVERLARLVPEGALACFVVLNPQLQVQPPHPPLPHIPTLTVEKPNELHADGPRALRAARSFWRENVTAARQRREIARQAIAFGREQGVGCVWAVLEGQTMIHLARRVARGLGVPLRCQVMDPPEWWLQAHGVDGWSTRRTLRAFDAALASSRSILAASEPMRDAFTERYGIPAVALLPGIDSSLARPPATRPHPRGPLTIGFAGQFYAPEEWNMLVGGLSEAGWRLGDRPVRLRVLARSTRLDGMVAGEAHVLGWRPEPEVVASLADVDFLFLPYWFSPTKQGPAILSFPSKLATYMAAGRPVVFHGPASSAPGRFLERHQAAFMSTKGSPAALVAVLRAAAQDPKAYARVARAGSKVLRERLTLEAMAASLAAFLEVPVDWLRTGPAQRRGREP